MSQADLAEAVGKSHAYTNQTLTGRKSASPEWVNLVGSRRLSNVCWNQPVRATLSPLRPATNRAGQSPGKVKKAHDPVSRMATRSRVMCEFRLKKELGMERCRDNAPPIPQEGWGDD
jgi:hypothetical protein